jgi:hypothetical protein
VGAIAYRLSAEVRRSWRGALGVVVLLGLLGGVVLSCVAGARRTASAYPRLLERTEASELLVSPLGAPRVDPTRFYDAVAALPGVLAVGVIGGMPVLPLVGTATAAISEDVSNSESLDIGVAMASVDGHAIYEIARPRMLEGRLPDPSRADEVMVSWRLAQTGHFAVGDVLDFVVVSNDVVEAKVSAEPSDGTPIQVTVTGIGVLPTEIVPFSDLDDLGTMVFTPPVAAMADRSEWGFEGIQVDVAPGADVPALATQIEALGAESEDTGGRVFVSDLEANASEVQDGLRPLSVALAAFAAVVAVVGLFVVGQAVVRHTRVAPTEATTLASLGVVPGQRVAVTLGRTLLVAVAGAALAALVAVALSPRFPIGPARVAEPDPGLRVDTPVLVLGAVVIVLLTLVSVVPAALLRSRRSGGAQRAATAISSNAARAGLPAPAVQGIRFALDTGSAAAAPVRSTLVAVAAAMAAVLAAATFAASLALLVDTPARYGQGWDRLLDAQFAPVAAGLVVERYRDDARVVGMAAGAYTEVVVGGERVPAVTMLTVTGDTGLTVARGKRADGPGQVALGGEVLDELALDVGDTVEVDGGAGPQRMLVVGELVFPRFNQGSFGQTGLGVGAQLHPDALPPFEVAEEDGFTDLEELFALDGRYHHFVAFDLGEEPGALDDELRRLVEDKQMFAFIRHEQPPTTISDLERVRSVPVVLAAVLAAAAAAVLGHLLVSAVRGRRRDFAILATFGFVPSQLRAAVGWHATVVAVVASVIGIPIGVAAGRILWTRFADGIHAASAPTVPWPWLLLAVPAAVLLANVVAAVPGRWASRTRPASALRAE